MDGGNAGVGCWRVKKVKSRNNYSIVCWIDVYNDIQKHKFRER